MTTRPRKKPMPVQRLQRLVSRWRQEAQDCPCRLNDYKAITLTQCADQLARALKKP